jgi:hypothetical protein
MRERWPKQEWAGPIAEPMELPNSAVFSTLSSVGEILFARFTGFTPFFL